jgi:hypothetical protein
MNWRKRWECFKWGHLDDVEWIPVSPRPDEHSEKPVWTCKHCGRVHGGIIRRLIPPSHTPPGSKNGTG